MLDLKNIKTQLIIFLSAFAIYVSLKENNTAFLLTTSLAVISAIAIEASILFFKKKGFSVTDSSIISGLIIGFVLATSNPWWMFLLASFLAISSKHLIQINKKHLFNPAAFGIVIADIFFGASMLWKGCYLWYMLVPFGLYFIYKIQKMEVLIGYLLAALGLFGLQAVMQKMPVLDIFGYLNYYYIFIMMIEPKTTPVKPLGKFVFGIGVAVLIFVFSGTGVRADAELLALLIINLFVPLLNKIPSRR